MKKSGFKKAASPHQGEAAHNKSPLLADKDCAIRTQSQACLNYAEAQPSFSMKREFTFAYSLLSRYPESTPNATSENRVYNLNIKFAIRLKL